MLLLEINDVQYNLCRTTIEIIDSYIGAVQGNFKDFMDDMENLKSVSQDDPVLAMSNVHDLLRPNVDARIFEIVSFAILKSHFQEQRVFWGWTLESIKKESLILFKTGRTNANDGGIDFVMKPLGRFFQVTETVDVAKYFLDIEKVLHYPITFVVKSELGADVLIDHIRERAENLYPVRAVVDKYMSSIEEVISIPNLALILEEISEAGRMIPIVDEILLYSRVEFNLD